MDEQPHSHPHLLVFPFPAKGHIKPFLCFAELLSAAALQVTFLNTDYNHRRIHNRRALTARFPTLHFASISDGLPPDHPRDISISAVYSSMRDVTKPLLRDLLLSYAANRPVTSIITDVIFAFPIEVAEDLGIPVFSFCPFSARYLSLYFLVPKLVEDGQLPYSDGDVDWKIHGVAGSEDLIRRKDIPGSWSVGEVGKLDPMNFVSQTLASSRSSGLIINTFEEIEAPFLKLLSEKFRKIYTVGPVHSLLNSSGGPWEEDGSCLRWLDSRPARSVVFVSFGSLVRITSGELMEFWNGLVKSGKSFLLVLRSDVVKDDESKVAVNEIVETDIEGRGMVVGWAPQEEVLAHEAVGGFLTHSGWNSTLESIAAGVPMICWPKMTDQFSNCTWACKVWKIGLEIEAQYDRATVERMVRLLMEEGEELKKSIAELSERAKVCVGKDGTSFRNLQSFIEEMKKIK